MAARQVYGFNPATNRVEHHYLDMGRMSASIGHARPVISTFVQTASSVEDNGDRMVPNGGTRQARLDPMREAA